MATVELIDVRKVFGTVEAVAGVSLRIAQGEFVAILGPSGCGKTTTLNLLAGFIDPTSGEILIDSKPMAGTPPHRRNIGVVFQSYALFPHLSVFDNVAFGLRMRKVAGAEIATRVRHALDIVQLGALEERSTRQLSGGQQQRVALARALVVEPALLLLDEPLSNLDANLREQMRFEIREIQRRVGITTVFVTHDQSEAMAAADRLVIMNKGVIAQAGTVREIYTTPRDPFVASFIGQANVIPGKAVGVNDSQVRIELSGGDIILASRSPGVPNDGSVVMILRPEDLTLSNVPVPDHNALAGTVKRVSFLGSTVNVGVQVAGQVISVVAHRDQVVPDEGQAIYVVWKKAAEKLFAQP
jgi:spermidine/putrescine ABC transporter ATP-binding subunit